MARIYLYIKYLFILFLLFSNIFVSGQDRFSPELIKSKGTYIHKSTKLNFPELIDVYQRKSIYSFDKQNENIEVAYENQQSPNTVVVKIHLSPAGDGTEGRLRQEYLTSLNSTQILSSKEFTVQQYPIKRYGTKYICNGFRAILNYPKQEQTNHLSVYECGNWFLKIEISSTGLDSTQVVAIENSFLNKYDPGFLTALKPLNLKSDLLIAPGLKKFGVNTKHVINSALKKLKWVNENVSENERVSGFPDLYLAMHIEALNELILSGSGDTNPDNELGKLINNLRKVSKAGYLAEFIMKHYKMVMIVPENMKLDYDGFEKWQAENKFFVDFHSGNNMIENKNQFAIDLTKGCYLIVYRQKK